MDQIWKNTASVRAHVLHKSVMFSSTCYHRFSLGKYTNPICTWTPGTLHLQSKVSRKGRWSLPWMFFVAFVQFVSKLFFPNLYWDFNGWTCNPVPGPQDAQRRVAIIVTMTDVAYDDNILTLNRESISHNVYASKIYLIRVLPHIVSRWDLSFPVGQLTGLSLSKTQIMRYQPGSILSDNEEPLNKAF